MLHKAHTQPRCRFRPAYLLAVSVITVTAAVSAALSALGAIAVSAVVPVCIVIIHAWNSLLGNLTVGILGVATHILLRTAMVRPRSRPDLSDTVSRAVLESGGRVNLLQLGYGEIHCRRHMMFVGVGSDFICDRKNIGLRVRAMI